MKKSEQRESQLLKDKKNEDPHSFPVRPERDPLSSLLDLRGHFVFSPPSPEPEHQLSLGSGVRRVSFSPDRGACHPFWSQAAVNMEIS
jgi:hypothetical protein